MIHCTHVLMYIHAHSITLPLIAWLGAWGFGPKLSMWVIGTRAQEDIARLGSDVHTGKLPQLQYHELESKKRDTKMSFSLLSPFAWLV